MQHRIFTTFTGPFALMLDDNGDVSTSWVSDELRRKLAGSRCDDRLLPELSRKLMDYFAGEDVDFSDVPTPGGSAFFRKCWVACRRIQKGETRSYAELAAMAGGGPGSARAAGQAMRANPLPIIVPCHRVIGASGALHGFGGSCDIHSKELGVKRKLLKMEGALDDRIRHSVRTTAKQAALC